MLFNQNSKGGTTMSIRKLAHAKRGIILSFLAMVILMLGSASTVYADTPLPNGTLLTIDQGAGSATNIPCSTGSCFGVETSPGMVQWTDFGPGVDGGVLLGIDQISGGQEIYPADSTSGALSAAWNAFGAYGTFATAPMIGLNATGIVTTVTTGSDQNVFDSASCADVASCLGKTTLGTWHVAWNGYTLPLGSSLGCLSINPGDCLGVTSWTLTPSQAMPIQQSTYVLNYQWAVPDGDPSGYGSGNEKFLLILRGTVSVSIPGLCAGVTCTPTAIACKQNTCNPLTGLCELSNVSNGTTCNDGNACTSNDVCINGTCAGTPVVCPPAVCKQANGCDPSTGVCNYANSPSGTTCTSTNKCLVSPTCDGSGTCAGTTKSCDLGNVCKNYGTCNTGTGNCPLATNKADGTACNDNNACTLNDACVNGTCLGTPKNCSDNIVCTYDTCDSVTGQCSNLPITGCGPGTPLPNGTLLGLDQGAGSATNTPCITGSCFGAETLPGIVQWTDFGPGTDGGIVVGKAQASGGQEAGLSNANSTPGELTAAWLFFGAYGTFFTSPGGDIQNIFDKASCAGAACLEKTTLAVFNVARNGDIYPLGSVAGCTNPNCTDDQRNGINVDDYQINPVTGGAWSMKYNQVVQNGQFTGVKFTAVMRGIVVTAFTSVGNNISVQPVDTSTSTTPVTLTFAAIIQAGITTLTTGSVGPGISAGFKLGDPPTYYELTTTAQTTGAITVCINYQGVQYNDESQLTIYHFENGVPVDRTIPLSLDPTNHVICASVTSLSPFVILEKIPDCSDSNPCTTDTYDTAQGCIHAPVANGTHCDDNNPATINDVCTNGTCAGTKPNIFYGFFSPVDNPSNLNLANSGQTIPVKWRITNANGTPISNPASFVSLSSYAVSCTTYAGDAADAIEEYSTGSSGLQYLGDGNWQFNWKTSKAFTGQCRMMVLTLGDKSTHTADFKFK
jgi:hypothetical protein